MSEKDGVCRICAGKTQNNAFVSRSIIAIRNKIFKGQPLHAYEWKPHSLCSGDCGHGQRNFTGAIRLHPDAPRCLTIKMDIQSRANLNTANEIAVRC